MFSRNMNFVHIKAILQHISKMNRDFGAHCKKLGLTSPICQISTQHNSLLNNITFINDATK